MLNLKTKTIKSETVAKVVRHLLHDDNALPDGFDIWHVDEAAARFDPTLDEYFAALVAIIATAREIVRLDAIDAECEARAISARPVKRKNTRSRRVAAQPDLFERIKQRERRAV
jgi:hypothetical protein